MEDIQDLNYDDELYLAFEQSLLDYVPYAIDYANVEVAEDNPFSNFFRAESPIYAPVEVKSLFTDEMEIQNELVFLMRFSTN